MHHPLSRFAARLRGLIHDPASLGATSPVTRQFNALALELFALQFEGNPAYRKICLARQRTPDTVEDWTQIPCVPTGAFKELELSSLPPTERTTTFHSSGTTEQKPSRHFHGPDSLALYEASLWRWFEPRFPDANRFIFLTPKPEAAPHSSLVHMFDTVRQRTGGGEFFGQVASDGTWTVAFDAVTDLLRSAASACQPLTLLGTAFSFVHWLDFLAAREIRFKLPANSRVMETGGYKNRSRTMPKAELHQFITDRLGVGREDIVCEYGMSELSSQAYDSTLEPRSPTQPVDATVKPATPAASVPGARHFHFPPWARVRIISPETGREVRDGEAGLIRVFDLANVYSVAAIQTEDLALRRGAGFELIGRAQLAEPRGCSLLAA